MSTNLMTINASFQGPFPESEIAGRAKGFGAGIFEPEDSGSWFEVFVHFTREDDAAPVAVSPGLLSQVFEEDLGMQGKLPLAQLGERDPASNQYKYFRFAGDFRMAKQVTTLVYIDARMLPAEPKDFEIESTSYEGKPDGDSLIALIFAPARPATLLESAEFDSPAALAQHNDTIYVGCAGKYSNKAGGLFRWNGGSSTEIKLAKKAPKVHALLADGDTLWVGTSNGLYEVRSDAVVASWKSKEGMPGKAVLSLAKHGERVFAGCSGGYAWLSDGKLDGHKDSAFKNAAQLCKDPNGTLWIGTDAALHSVKANQYDFDRVSGYRAVSHLAATSHGVFARLFRGGTESLAARFKDGDAKPLCGIYPVGALEDDLLVRSGGLVRADGGEISQRILFDVDPHTYVVLGGRLWGLWKDSVAEIDTASWSKEATINHRTSHSPVIEPRG